MATVAGVVRTENRKITREQQAGLGSFMARLNELRQRVVLLILERGNVGAGGVAGMQRELEDLTARYAGGLEEIMTANQRRLFVRGIKLVDEALKRQGLVPAVPYLSEALLEEMKGYSAQLVRGITDDVKRRITTEIRLGSMGQKRPEEIIRTIGRTLGEQRSIFGSAGHRASVIFKTEGQRVLNMAAVRRIQQIDAQLPGQVKKQWMHSHATAPRPGHWVLEGTVVPADKPFIIQGQDKRQYKAQGPHDPTLPAFEVVNCKCTVIPVFAPNRNVIPPPAIPPRPPRVRRQKPAAPPPAPPPAPKEPQKQIPLPTNAMEAEALGIKNWSTWKKASKAAQRWRVDAQAEWNSRPPESDALWGTNTERDYFNALAVKRPDLSTWTQNDMKAYLEDLRPTKTRVGGITAHGWDKVDDVELLREAGNVFWELGQDWYSGLGFFGKDQTSDAYAYVRGGTTMMLGPMSMNITDLERRCLRDEASGFHPRRDKISAYRSVLTHEFGHTVVLEPALTPGAKAKLQALYNEHVRASEFVAATRRKYWKVGAAERAFLRQEMDEMKGKSFVSTYAQKNINELIAESFAEHYSATRPSPMSQRVMEVLLQDPELSPKLRRRPAMTRRIPSPEELRKKLDALSTARPDRPEHERRWHLKNPTPVLDYDDPKQKPAFAAIDKLRAVNPAERRELEAKVQKQRISLDKLWTDQEEVFYGTIDGMIDDELYRKLDDLPIAVVQAEDGRYLIADGNNRTAYARLLGQKDILAEVIQERDLKPRARTRRRR